MCPVLPGDILRSGWSYSPTWTRSAGSRGYPWRCVCVTGVDMGLSNNGGRGMAIAAGIVMGHEKAWDINRLLPTTYCTSTFILCLHKDVYINIRIRRKM